MRDMPADVPRAARPRIQSALVSLLWSQGVIFHPGEWAKCPGRKQNGRHGSVPCGEHVILAPHGTTIEIRVCELRALPGEGVQFCRSCKSKLAIRLTEVA